MHNSENITSSVEVISEKKKLMQKVYEHIKHIHVVLRPILWYTWVSRYSHKGETYLNNHWIYISRVSFLLHNQ